MRASNANPRDAGRELSVAGPIVGAMTHSIGAEPIDRPTRSTRSSDRRSRSCPSRSSDRLSPSRAADFKACPLLYRFRCIDRLPEAPSPRGHPRHARARGARVVVRPPGRAAHAERRPGDAARRLGAAARGASGSRRSCSPTMPTIGAPTAMRALRSPTGSSRPARCSATTSPSRIRRLRARGSRAAGRVRHRRRTAARDTSTASTSPRPATSGSSTTRPAPRRARSSRPRPCSR